jgi:hypothetical protein
MDIRKIKELSAEDRKLVLQSEASSVEEGRYTKPLTESEILNYKNVLAEQSIQQAIILNEFKVVKEGFKSRLTPIAKEISSAIQAIKFKAVDLEGKLYLLPDYESQLIHKVDGDGNHVSSRPMRPEERQYFLSATSKSA